MKLPFFRRPAVSTLLVALLVLITAAVLALVFALNRPAERLTVSLSGLSEVLFPTQAECASFTSGEAPLDHRFPLVMQYTGPMLEVNLESPGAFQVFIDASGAVETTLRKGTEIVSQENKPQAANTNLRFTASRLFFRSQSETTNQVGLCGTDLILHANPAVTNAPATGASAKPLPWASLSSLSSVGISMQQETSDVKQAQNLRAIDIQLEGVLSLEIDGKVVPASGTLTLTLQPHSTVGQKDAYGNPRETTLRFLATGLNDPTLPSENPHTRIIPGLRSREEGPASEAYNRRLQGQPVTFDQASGTAMQISAGLPQGWYTLGRGKVSIPNGAGALNLSAQFEPARFTFKPDQAVFEMRQGSAALDGREIYRFGQ